MKVEKLSIQRIHVTLSCGCSVACDFRDPQCKEPFRPLKDAETSIAAKDYSICDKHTKDAGRPMLEFMMGERMDEAVEEAQKAPAKPAGTKLNHPIPVIPTKELQGETVEKIPIPSAPNRPHRPPGVRKLQRSREQLAAAGAIAGISQAVGGVEFSAGTEDLDELDRQLAEPEPSSEA